MITITGNPRTFTGEADLTDETYDALLTIFVKEIDRCDRAGLGPLHAGIRALREVRRVAVAHDWGPSAAARLELTAGVIYGRFFAEVNAEMLIDRARSSRG